MTIVELLVAIAIIVLLATVVINVLMDNAAQKKAALGTLPNGTTPAGRTISDTWTTPPTTVTRSVNTTFTFNAASSQVSGVLPVAGRRYVFNVQPAANITIVSITPAFPGTTDQGTTDAAGNITIVIRVNSLPPVATGDTLPKGAVVATQSHAPSGTPPITAAFTVQ